MRRCVSLILRIPAKSDSVVSSVDSAIAALTVIRGLSDAVEESMLDECDSPRNASHSGNSGGSMAHYGTLKDARLREPARTCAVRIYTV
jgi:hypothetical protein